MMNIVKLEEICNIKSGGTPSRSHNEYWKNGKIPWVKISDIKGKYLFETDECITQEGLNNSSAKLFSKGTILYTIFATLGEVCFLDIDASTNQAIAGLEIISDTVYPEYLYYYLVSKKESVKNIGRGVAQNNINLKILKTMDVPLPCIEKQKSISIRLDSIGKLIEFRKKQLSKLDGLVKARFVEMFGDPVSNSNNWRFSKLKDLTTKIGSGATPKGGKNSYINEGVSFIRSMNVHDGRFEYKELAHITNEQALQLNNVIVCENDVLINITGASVARSCVVPNNILPARVNQHVSIIRLKNDVMNCVFVNNLFFNESFKKLLLATGESGGATRQAITKQQLENLIIITPPIELQNEFAEFVEQVEKSKKDIQQSLEKLETLKKSLMQEYFG